MTTPKKKLGDSDVKAGDILEVAPGIDIKVVDQDEINASADEGVGAFACLPTSMALGVGASIVPGSRIVKCDECGCDCWMSPATYGCWQSSDAKIFCIGRCVKTT